MRQKLIIRISAALVLGAAGVINWMTTEPDAARELPSWAFPPDEISDEIIAMRGCIEGVDHVSGKDLTNFAQIVACDDHVAIASDKVSARYWRALHLHENGITDAHHEQAYQDYTFIIDSGQSRAVAFANRAMLTMRLRDAPHEALADMNTAIELREENPRASYFRRRAAILLVIAWEQKEEARAHQALEDLRRLETLDPDNRDVSALKEAAHDLLRSLHIDEGQDVQKG
jgi:tetratricopeptide (TPR) repeat protein